MSITVPVSSQFPHPPLATVNGIYYMGLFSGSGTITPPTLRGYGLVASLQGVGPGWGYEVGYRRIYEGRLALFVVQWDIGITGTTQEQLETINEDYHQFWFAEQLPARMHYDIGPSASFDLYGLVLI